MIIAVTGLIGAGKSTVSRMFSDLGFWVIDVDRLSHDILQDQEVKSRLVALFGEEILEMEKVNRSFLAEIAFSSQEKLEALNPIIHPLLIRKLIEETKMGDVVIDVALFNELRIDELSDVVVLVKTGESVRKDRIGEELYRRSRFQVEPDSPDFVIDNSGGKQKTKEQVRAVCRML